MRNMELYLIISYNFNKKEELLTPKRMLVIGEEYIENYLFQRKIGDYSDYAERIFLMSKDDNNMDIHIVTAFDGANSMGLATLAFNDAGGVEFRDALKKMLLSSALTDGFIELRVLFEKFMEPRVPNIKDVKDREMVKSIVDMFIRKTTTYNTTEHQPVPGVLPNENINRTAIRPDMMLSADINEKSMVSDTIMSALERHHKLTIVYNEVHDFIQCNIYKESKEMM